MHTKIDNQVFKLKDARVTALSRGRLSTQQLANMIRPGDCIIFKDGTIYALTEAEYYAAQRTRVPTTLTKEQFQDILNWPEKDFSQQDYRKIQDIKKRKAKCSTCQYNTYKSRVLNIVGHHPQLLQRIIKQDIDPVVPAYPQTTAPVRSKVSKVFPHFFGKTEYGRKPCLDCVQKHVSVARSWELLNQAYVKGCQTLQGYPEHFALALANMEEAFEECPKDCEELRDIIMFCIGKSKKENQLFLPIENILYIIQLARAETSTEEALDQNQPDEAFALQLSAQMKQDLYALPITMKARLLGILEKLLEVEYVGGTQQRVLYQGHLATLADMLVNVCPAVSNVLRNRRLMFKAAPQLVQNTEYDCKDVKEALTQPVKVSENTSSDSGSTLSA